MFEKVNQGREVLLDQVWVVASDKGVVGIETGQELTYPLDVPISCSFFAKSLVEPLSRNHIDHDVKQSWEEQAPLSSPTESAKRITLVSTCLAHHNDKEVPEVQQHI